jgi:hypothetical protein
LVPCKNYKELINNFEKKYLEEKTDIFYSKLSEILKEFLEERENKNISKMTFNEINKLNLEENIKNLIKNIYFKEYKQSFEDNNEIRKNLIEEVKKIIN